MDCVLPRRCSLLREVVQQLCFPCVGIVLGLWRRGSLRVELGFSGLGCRGLGFRGSGFRV